MAPEDGGESMSKVFGTIGLVAAGLMLLGTLDEALAGGGRDMTFQMPNRKTLFIQRYPGDQAFAGGTVRMQGPEKGPYVERCNWSAKPGIFGLPYGFTQTCYRHTLENTPE